MMKRHITDMTVRRRRSRKSAFIKLVSIFSIIYFSSTVDASLKPVDQSNEAKNERFKLSSAIKLPRKSKDNITRNKIEQSTIEQVSLNKKGSDLKGGWSLGYFGSLWDKAPKEVRFLTGFLGIFGSFLYWGYLQERITGHKYTSLKDPSLSQQWSYPFFLNTFMACSGFAVGSLLHYLVTRNQPQKEATFRLKDFIRPAASYTLGSPFGYTALRFINFPLLILAKSCKLVPVMLMGIIIAKKKYAMSEYLAVGLITLGVALYSMKPGSLTQSDSQGGLRQLFGLGLVLINLLLDGYTAAHQDKINAQSKVSSFQMMKYMNMWSMILMVSYLVGSYAVLGTNSELAAAITFCRNFPQVVPHLFRFGLCAATGQIFVYSLIKEFGALAYITVTIMRKFFTILISIAIFKHHMRWWQWIGIFSVFGGLMVNVYGKYKK